MVCGCPISNSEVCHNKLAGRRIIEGVIAAVSHSYSFYVVERDVSSETVFRDAPLRYSTRYLEWDDRMFPSLHWDIRYKGIQRVVTAILQTVLGCITIRLQDHEAN